MNLMALVSEVGMAMKATQSEIYGVTDFAGYDNNTKCDCSTGKFGVASESRAIIFGVIKD